MIHKAKFGQKELGARWLWEIEGSALDQTHTFSVPICEGFLGELGRHQSHDFGIDTPTTLVLGHPRRRNRKTEV